MRRREELEHQGVKQTHTCQPKGAHRRTLSDVWLPEPSTMNTNTAQHTHTHTTENAKSGDDSSQRTNEIAGIQHRCSADQGPLRRASTTHSHPQRHTGRAAGLVATTKSQASVLTRNVGEDEGQTQQQVQPMQVRQLLAAHITANHTLRHRTGEQQKEAKSSNRGRS